MLDWSLRLDSSLAFIGRAQSPHGLLLAAFRQHFKKEMSAETIARLQHELADYQDRSLGAADEDEEEFVATQIAETQKTLEAGKAAVSTDKWLSTSASAELALVRLNHRVTDALTQRLLKEAGQDWDMAQECLAGRGEVRDFRVCSLVRGEGAAQAMRDGGRLVQESANIGEWILYMSKVGRGAAPAFIAFCVTARMLGGIYLRFNCEAQHTR